MGVGWRVTWFAVVAVLVVFVEFEDGTRVCRVVDIPAGYGKNVIVVRLME